MIVRYVRAEFGVYNLNGIVILTSMKHSQLSQFQKEQYASYLETQLERFSAFMLLQKK